MEATLPCRLDPQVAKLTNGYILGGGEGGGTLCVREGGLYAATGGGGGMGLKGKWGEW